MSKKFNITGLCIPERDYMADISGKLDTIICQYIQQGKYRSEEHTSELQSQR